MQTCKAAPLQPTLSVWGGRSVAKGGFAQSLLLTNTPRPIIALEPTALFHQFHSLGAKKEGFSHKSTGWKEEKLLRTGTCFTSGSNARSTRTTAQGAMRERASITYHTQAPILQRYCSALNPAELGQLLERESGSRSWHLLVSSRSSLPPSHSIPGNVAVNKKPALQTGAIHKPAVTYQVLQTACNSFLGKETGYLGSASHRSAVGM